MLIIDSRNVALQETGGQFDWPGPFCLYVPFGAANSLEHMVTPDEWFVFEFTSIAPSTLSALRDIMVATDRTMARATSSVLFINDTADALSTLDHAKTAVADPKAFEYSIGDDEDLHTLICGHSFGADPMLVTFFRYMNKGMGPEHTKCSLDMMPLHLGN